MEFPFLNGGKKMPKISVVMPVYNTKKEFLCEAVESILNQTFSDFEFLIIDDGSTDPCVKETVSTYHDPRIKYFYKDNSGVSDTLNFGLSKATGKYIARMDSDDISVPVRFEKQVAFLDSHPDVSLVGCWIEYFPEKKVWRTISEPRILDFLQGSQLAHPAVMFRKEDFEAKGLKYDKNLPCAQDYDLWSRAIMTGIKMANLQEILLNYRWHSNNISHTKKELQEKVAKDVKEALLKFMTSQQKVQQKQKEKSNQLS